MHKFILMVFTEDQRITMYTFWNIFFYKIKVEAKVYWIFLQQKNALGNVKQARKILFTAIGKRDQIAY